MNSLKDIKSRLEKIKNCNKKTRQEIKKNNLSPLSISCEIVGAGIFGFFIGNLLDNYLDTKFIFKFLILILALASSFYTIYKTTKTK